eukprot:Lankesteria_metandrocarpae@DN5418_c0_g1_i5.p1
MWHTMEVVLLRCWALWCYHLVAGEDDSSSRSKAAAFRKAPGRDSSLPVIQDNLNMWRHHCAYSYDIGQQRRIPPLTNTLKTSNPRLKQLMIMTRHGSRTPNNSHLDCWSGFDDLEWECGLNEGTSSIIQGGSYDNLDGMHELTFCKSYGDTMVKRNVLRGDCQRGQLLAEGAAQLRRVGSLVAAAYFDGAYDPALNTKQDPIYENPIVSVRDLEFNGTLDIEAVVYARSTDMQRTRLSAVNFLSSLIIRMFNGFLGDRSDFKLPVLHVLDDDIDYFRHNRKSERWKRTQLRRSDEYHTFMKSQEPVSKTVMPYLTGSKVIDQWPWAHKLFDCLVTSACTEWLYPNGGRRVAPVFQKNPELIQDVYNAFTEEVAFTYSWNNSVIAKLESHILTRFLRLIVIRAVCDKCLVERDTSSIIAAAHAVGLSAPEDEILRAFEITSRQPLHYLSAHDRNIRTLMFTMGIDDHRLVPFASLLIIEVYEIPLTGFHGIRVVYNSAEVTYSLPGCGKESLCNVASFFEATDWVIYHSLEKADEEAKAAKEITEVYTSSQAGSEWWTTVALLIVTAVISCAATLLCHEQVCHILTLI